MAAHGERHEKPGPAPPAWPMTFFELIYNITGDPQRTQMLIAIISCTVVSTWPIIITACLIAIKLHPLQLLYAAFASTFCSGSVITFIVIRVKKIRKSLKNDGASAGQQTKRSSLPQNPRPARKPRKPRKPRKTR
jgi:hypothetical protein